MREKIFAKKFGGVGNSPYFCTRYTGMTRAAQENKTFFESNSIKLFVEKYKEDIKQNSYARLRDVRV